VLLIQRSGALETKQSEHALAIQEAMRMLGLPPNLQMRIITFFTYERIHRSSRLFHALFQDVSPQLRFELQLHLYLDLVRKSSLFKRTRPHVIREIVVALEDVIYLPGDWICRCGDYGDCMYFVISGKSAVIGRDTVTELKVLERGSYFGEVALLMGVPRTAHVRANKFCIMARLTKDGFAPILRRWPEEIDVLTSGIEREADRVKIKAEAAKLYGVSRLTRVSSNCSDEFGLHEGQPKRLSQKSAACGRSDSAVSDTSCGSEDLARASARTRWPSFKPSGFGPEALSCQEKRFVDAAGSDLEQELSGAGLPRLLRAQLQEVNVHSAKFKHIGSSLSSCGSVPSTCSASHLSEAATGLVDGLPGAVRDTQVHCGDREHLQGMANSGSTGALPAFPDNGAADAKRKLLVEHRKMLGMVLLHLDSLLMDMDSLPHESLQPPDDAMSSDDSGISMPFT